jgi:hypothetical protein
MRGHPHPRLAPSAAVSATTLILDAAAIISGHSDLQLPIEIVRREPKLPVGVFASPRRFPPRTGAGKAAVSAGGTSTGAGGISASAGAPR